MSKRALVVASILVCVVMARASAKDAHVMVGTYRCTTHQNPGPDWRFVSVNQPYGEWLRADTTFPAQNGVPSQRAVAYLGFDSDAKRWNIVTVNGDGSYYTRSSASSDLSGSNWTDRAPADGGRARITLLPGEYMFDFSQIGKDGKVNRSHTVCMKGTR